MIELGLQRITRLLAKTALPWRAIHVAGTNGKGSVCNHISAMLEAYNASKYRLDHKQSRIEHGRFTSPHLIDRWDCITINQQTVSKKLFDHVEQRVKRRSEQEGIGASEFEVLTATAFECFNESEVDVGVVEVGMGGRLDATNILGLAEGLDSSLDPAIARPLPLVTAITSISLDHQGFLGNTVEEIAREKAGIFKKGVPVIVDISNDLNVRNVLAAEARNRGALNQPDSGIDEDPESQGNVYSDCALHVRSRHLFHEITDYNTDVALRSAATALAALGRGQYSTTKGGSTEWNDFLDDFRDAAFKTQFPGRLQMLDISSLTGREEEVLLDGAHNEQSASALRQESDYLREGICDSGMPPSVVWVLAFTSTKDVSAILDTLLFVDDKDIVVGVEFGPVDGMPWVEPLSCDKIGEAVRRRLGPDRRFYASGSVAEALSIASREANGGPLVIAGSLYLVSDVLRLLRDRKASAVNQDGT